METETLARAGGHDDQRIVAFEGGGHGLDLTGAETAKAEMFVEFFPQMFPDGGVERMHGYSRKIVIKETGRSPLGR